MSDDNAAWRARERRNMQREPTSEGMYTPYYDAEVAR